MVNVDVLPLIYAVGAALSAYAYMVEYRHDEAKRMGTSYKALCDFSVFSCTKVFTSEYGYLTQFVGAPPISNALLAVGVYFGLIFLSILSKRARNSLRGVMARKSARLPPHAASHMLVRFVRVLGRQFTRGPFHLAGVALGVLALLALGSIVATAGLFFILTVLLRDLCVVCMSVYVVNITSAIVVCRRYAAYCRLREALEAGV